MNRRIKTLITILSVAALSLNVTAFGAENRITAGVADAGDQTGIDSTTNYYDYDFDGKEGNLLLAVNPEPWYSVANETFFDPKIKSLGYLEGAGTASNIESGLSAPEQDQDDEKTYGCLSMELNNKFQAHPKERLRVSDTEKTEYKVGDVLLRAVYLDTGGESGRDYHLSTEIQVDYRSSWVSHVYQCVYSGKHATVWGSVSYDAMTAEEKEASDSMNRVLYENAKTDPGMGYENTGLLKSSDDNNRTMFSAFSLSENDIEEIGESIDEYMEIESQYTGDYNETDRKYGDHDGKTAFIFEPFEAPYYGYFNNGDMKESISGRSLIDCLHINLFNMKEDGKIRDSIYATITHELQHCIAYGYAGSKYESWINEWLAEGFSMLVYGKEGANAGAYNKFSPVKMIFENNLKKSVLINPYAYGGNTGSNRDANNNDYFMAAPLTQYFFEHVDKGFIKKLTELESLTTESVSDYLRKNTSHSLEGWISCFGIAFMAGIDGTELSVKKGGDLDIGNSPTIQYCMDIFKKNRELILKNAFCDLNDIKKGSTIAGGGTVFGYKNDKDRKVNILEAEEGVVYALRNSKGEIVSVEGLDTVDNIDKRTFTGKTVTVNGIMPADVNIKMLSSINFTGKKKPTADTVDLRISIEFKNSSDREKINTARIGLGTLSFKKYGSCFFYSGSEKLSKRPRLYNIRLKALPGASSDEKALIKEINNAIKSQLKNDPLYFDICPCPIDECIKEITLKKNDTKVKKAVCLFNGKKYKLKKSDFSAIVNDGKVIGIEGKGNFTGQYYLFNGNRVVKV